MEGGGGDSFLRGGGGGGGEREIEFFIILPLEIRYDFW